MPPCMRVREAAGKTKNSIPAVNERFTYHGSPRLRQVRIGLDKRSVVSLKSRESRKITITLARNGLHGVMYLSLLFSEATGRECCAMDYEEICRIIHHHGGTVESGINWTWAKFSDDKQGKAAFDRVSPYVENRGYYASQPNSENPNIRQGGFRFR